jgi:hypothetical protein
MTKMMNDELMTLAELVAEHENQLAAVEHAGALYSVCMPYVGLSAPGKKIVLIGLNPTGAMGRWLLYAYDPLAGLKPGAYQRYGKRQSGSKPSLTRPRYERCFRQVSELLDGEPIGLINTNICWNASSDWKSLPKALKTVAPLDRLLALIKGEVVVHGAEPKKRCQKLPALAAWPTVYCPHFAPLGKGNLPEIAAEIAAKFRAL